MRTTAGEPGVSDDRRDCEERCDNALRKLVRGRAVRNIQQKVLKQAARSSPRYAGLGQSHRDALIALAERPRSMSELARVLAVDPWNATKTVAQLIADGLAVKTPSDEDRRKAIIRATSSGLTLGTPWEKGRREIVRSVLSNFDTEELSRIVDAVERLAWAFERLDESDALPD